MRAPTASSQQPGGFTIVELMVSTVVMALLLITCVTAVDSVRRSVRSVRGKAEQFREARQAFELITKTLSQATLNTYWDYYYSSTGTNQPAPGAGGTVTPPSAYIRQSELQFQLGSAATLLGGSATPATHPGHAVFFQAPLGLTQGQGQLGSLLNARGFAIQFSDDLANRPPFFASYAIPVRHRYRLIEYRPPAERTAAVSGNAIYSRPTDWFRQNFAESTRVVADNILLLVLSPHVAEAAARAAKKPAWWIAPCYTYNSLDVDNSTPAVERVSINPAGEAVQGTQHLLPPYVTVTMVALDEASAARWADHTGNQPVDVLKEAGAPFTNAADHAADMEALETWLDRQKLSYETFSSSVPLRNARWDSRTF